MRNELLSRGIYAILNKELNMVYVGQTKMSFFVRWIEHLMVIPDYEDQPKKVLMLKMEQIIYVTKLKAGV